MSDWYAIDMDDVSIDRKNRSVDIHVTSHENGVVYASFSFDLIQKISKEMRMIVDIPPSTVIEIIAHDVADMVGIYGSCPNVDPLSGVQVKQCNALKYCRNCFLDYMTTRIKGAIEKHNGEVVKGVVHEATAPAKKA